MGSWTKGFAISWNQIDWVAATIGEDDLVPLLKALDQDTSTMIKVDKAEPFTVFLAGNTKVTNAFRTRAGLAGNIGSPDSNPFQ